MSFFESSSCCLWHHQKHKANSEREEHAMFGQPVTLRCTVVCSLSSSQLYSSTGERCGFIPFHFQMHKLNLKLESVDAAFPGLQSEPVWQEYHQGRISTERHCVIVIASKPTSLMLLSGISTEASKQGFLSQLGPVIPSLSFLCPLPKIPRKAVKSDRQWNQSSVLLPGYPPLSLRGTWGHSLWTSDWIILLCIIH